MITLTDSAIAAMKAAIEQTAEPAKGLRIKIEEGGCAGFKYVMGVETSRAPGDAVVETGGLCLFIDKGSQAFVNGLRVDFVTTLEDSGFVFHNPNATDPCDCGKSFA
ncbi:HesB/IscA family protein [Rhizobium grahamii]|uniref:Core domain-containing protein n=2 Tax=Rhizobium grahamii TaxID=1120045 RepID=S3H3G6_9HYPH|nr:iron-sulfur cluster assembly accessory protein [Rhizobium grahamii]EPE93717.1 hypothetical protein RGCCGE502_33001 [Rhizobium grahamii CCGE 502]RDJ01993.1 iron-sulfur cluster assembly accessory protein [Rhizobium grahamii]